MEVIRRLRARVDGMIARAVIARVNDALKVQRLQVTIRDEHEALDDAEHFQPYGFSAVPPEGSEVVTLAVAGARSNTIAICAQHPDKRPKGAAVESVGLYTGAQWRLYVDPATGIVHLGAQAGASFVARADLVDAEINRIWTLLSTWTVAPNDGGQALKTAATTAKLGVQSTAATKVKAT